MNIVRAGRGHVRAPTSPYKGLAPFEDSELDELLFFGRERDRAVIAANLVAARLTILYGPTGVGKSSVLRAGVARDLRALPERPLVVVHEAWADDPVGSLAESIAAAAEVEASSLGSTSSSRPRYTETCTSCSTSSRRTSSTTAADAALADGLAELLARPELPVHVAARDPRGRAGATRRVQGPLPGLLANRLRLDHLTRAGGRRAIVGPIERFGELVNEEDGLAVEPELVEAVLDGVRAGARRPGGPRPRRLEGRRAAGPDRDALSPARDAAALGGRARGGIARAAPPNARAARRARADRRGAPRARARRAHPRAEGSSQHGCSTSS